MLPESAARLERDLPEHARVLDVGAWGRPFRRADVVLDYMPYETRGLYGFNGTGPERFDKSTWVEHDICSRVPWPFDDNAFDFVICSHVLEDVRDPVWVASELQRVGRAGYVETPSRLEEQTFGIQGPWVGWGHHHWLVEVENGELVFVFKHHVVHGQPAAAFPQGFQQRLSPAERVLIHWWEDRLVARERIFTSPEDLDSYLADFVAEQLRLRPPPPKVAQRRRRRLPIRR